MALVTASPPSKDEVLESEEEIQPCEGSLLMVRRLLGSQLVELEQSQWKTYSILVVRFLKIFVQ